MARFLALMLVALIACGCSTLADNLRDRGNSLPEATAPTSISDLTLESLAADEPERHPTDLAQKDVNHFSPDVVMAKSAPETQPSADQQSLTQRWDEAISSASPNISPNPLVPRKEAAETPSPSDSFRLMPMVEPITSTTTTLTEKSTSPVVAVVHKELRSSYTALAHEGSASNAAEATTEPIEPDDTETKEPIRELDQLFAQIQSANKLRLERVCLCQRVDGFGQVTDFGDSPFSPGQRVLIYCEVNNFKTVPDSSVAENGHKACLSGCYVVTDAKGHIVAEREYSAVDDCSSSLRADFFLVFPARIPDVEPGWYRLYLVVYDEVGRDMVAQGNPIQFRIGTEAEATVSR